MHFEMQCEKVTPEKISDVNRVSLVSEMKLLSDGQGEIPDHKNDDSMAPVREKTLDTPKGCICLRGKARWKSNVQDARENWNGKQKASSEEQSKEAMILFLGSDYRQNEELAIKDTVGADIKSRKYESTPLVQGEPNAVRLESLDDNNKSFPRNQQVKNKIKCKCIENTIDCKLKNSMHTVKSNA